MSRNVSASMRKGAPVFAALGDVTRLRLLTKLSSGGPLSIAQLTDGEDVTRQAITKHLAVLADAGLVRDSWRGRERLWELELAPLDEARICLDLVSRRWDERLARLKALVEDDPTP
ncbi:MAG: helix-turn-helix transcriptional regulator [Deltaproteobacteria bacterium]|nr:helix-turn-helix transcriptional regulator [Deltaproteobacteria bacterium]MDQ3298029.1 metalloregulator ArsR/SmtB family transcription factor [Myxococcota bacterium]